ncbi:MAG: FAD-dependent oxidoreductase [Pseudomonadota bacterium]
MSRRVVIVGGGQAGASAAAKLRALGHDGPITMLSAEPVPPYQRPPLSKKYLLGSVTRERLYLKPESFYADNDIELALGEPAEAIDRHAQEVVTQRRRLPYDALLLATGSVPRRLPAEIGGDLPGVLTMRDLADADAMAPLVVEGGHAIVIGGGYIGLEAAAVAASRGMAVTLIEAAPRILGRVAAAETADALRALHQAHGVEILEGSGLARLEPGGERRLRAVLTDDRVIDVDFALVGIGVTPGTALAEAAGLALENGIRTDETARSSDPAIWAAGDCASFPWQDGRIRLESVQNAIDQAEHAAAAMLGETAPYKPSPWFWSDQFDTKLQIAGLNLGHDRVICRPGSREGALSIWYASTDRLIAVDAINEPRAYMQGKRWLEAGITPDLEALADPARELKSLV